MSRKRKAAKIEYLQKKLQKLQKKIDLIQEDSDSSDPEEEDQREDPPENIDQNNMIRKDQEDGDALAEKENAPEDKIGEILDEDILELLGENPQRSKALDIKLHESLKLRWNYWITHGIEKKLKEELTEKYARSTEFDASKLNAEISALLTESAIKRNSFIVENQKLTGSALTAIGSALTMIMTEEDVDKLVLVQRLNEAAKLIMDIHYNETESRKAFIYPGVKIQLKNMLKNTKTDSLLLYGANLGDKIKESKNVEKLSQNVKNQPVPKATTQYRNNAKYLKSGKACRQGGRSPIVQATQIL